MEDKSIDIFYRTWLKKSKLGRMLPRMLFLFGFPKGKNIRESYDSGDYISLDLTLMDCEDVDRDYPYWKEYIEDLKNDLGFVIPYVDEQGNVYELIVDALCRETKLRDGRLPIALVTEEKVFYAGDDPMLILPECFN